ncbi:MAG TPA: hypothetical protein VF256_18085, partial [Streptosporangiaceae bacterium]
MKRAPVHAAGPCGVERRGVEWRGPLSRPGPVYRVRAQAVEVLAPVRPGFVAAAREAVRVFV